MLWTCTTVQQGHGPRLSSAWRAGILQLHLLGTWLCSLVDTFTLEVRCCAGRGGGHGVLMVACVLSVCACCGVVVMFAPATARCLTRATAGAISNVVDLYNSATGTWSTAQLSVARGNLAAASFGNVALFAGGWTGSALLCREGRGHGVLMVVCGLSVCACSGASVPFALRPLAVSRAPLQVMCLKLLTCTTVQQGRGRRLSSA